MYSVISPSWPLTQNLIIPCDLSRSPTILQRLLLREVKIVVHLIHLSIPSIFTVPVAQTKRSGTAYRKIKETDIFVKTAYPCDSRLINFSL